MQRKTKSHLEKSVRSIKNRVNEKRIAEMNFKMMNRVLAKIISGHKR